MDKYKKLISNTLIFAIGTFSSKVLVFLLMPLYTWALNSEQFGTADLIVQTGNLLIPLVTLGIINAIIRFGLDKNTNKSDVFSTGLITILIGFLILLLFAPLLTKISVISGHTVLVYIFVLMSSFRSLCSQFVRARNHVRLYALDGILSTVTIIIFNLLFLIVFKLGVTGYVLAIICSDALSSVFLSVTASLWKYVKFQGINRNTAADMIKYSLPLIPNMLCWWITNSSDKFMVAYMISNSANGLLTAAYKIPTIINLVSTIFMDAWQMSAVTEEENRGHFFTKVFHVYSASIFVAASGIILFSKILMKMLIIMAKDSNYEISWRYIPFLVLATAFSCFFTFIGIIYTVEKKSVLSLVTMLAGAVVNIILNLILIPIWGINGAGFATFISYVTVFILRVLNTRKYIKINLNTPKIIVNTLLLFIQSMILIFELPNWIIYESIFFLLILIINLKEILAGFKRLNSRKKAI